LPLVAVVLVIFVAGVPGPLPGALLADRAPELGFGYPSKARAAAVELVICLDLGLGGDSQFL
jgi:hypothetical protein